MGGKLEERSWRDHKNWIWELKKSRKARRRSRKLEEGRERMDMMRKEEAGRRGLRG